jgi:uncharacterized protein HemX
MKREWALFKTFIFNFKEENIMAEVNENSSVIDTEVKEETAMATTTQPAAPEKTKIDIIGMVKTGAKVVGAVALTAIAFCAGMSRGEKKAAKTSKEENNVVDAEPTNEDEVSE